MKAKERLAMRELTPAEIEIVSGGGWLDSPAFEGGAIGGMLGSIFGAGFTGSSSGAGAYGTVGAALGFSFGLGYGIGTAIYDYASKQIYG